MSPKCLLAAVAVLAMGTSSQRAEANNEVRAVTFTEDAGTTLVHVRGEQTPTFTVYKLERPSRVVIDMPQARLSEALRGHESASVLTPNTWAVSTITAQQLDDGGTRVIVSLARPGRYDVKTDGNEVVIMVMPRDAAPKTANPAELEKAKAQAQAAEQEAARLRTLAAEQAARAESAQKTVEEAKKLSAKDLERAKQLAAAANAEAARAKTEAAKAQTEADRARNAALAEAAQAKAQRDTATAQRDAATAQRDAATAEAGAAKAQAEDAMKKLEAAQRAAEVAKREADTAKREAMAAKSDAAKAKNDDTKKKLEASQRAAELAQREADAAKREAETAKREAEIAKTEMSKANAAAMRAQTEAQTAKSQAQTAMTQAQTAMSDAQTAKAEAARIKQAAEAMRAQADAERLAAANDKQAAEAARAKAEKLMSTAKQQLAQLDAKTAAAQALEDKARTTLAAAQAREEAARESAAQAQKERQIAEAAAKTAQAAASKSAAADRAKLLADAEAAEARLAKAKRAMEDAEARRVAAEQAASSAKQQLDQQKTALATVEQQRTVAVSAATDAARKRSEAEAAAFDAAKKKADAERAAKDADSRRTAAELAAKDADSKRASAELAAKQADQQRTVAEEAAKAAEKQRSVAETAAKQAMNAKRDAEASLAELTAKRQSAEKAAQELAARTKAEAKAQADMIAAQSRKASDDEIAAAKREVARLADERKRAESELADRRKAVAQQQAEATRLETAAAQARDAATREESRKTQLAEQRAAEEQELARLKAQKAAALVAAQVKPQPVQAQVAPLGSVQTRSMTPVKTPNAKVSNVTFKGNDTAGTVELAVTGDANITLGDVTASHVELIVDHADLAVKLERTLDVSKFGSPVKKVSAYRDRRTADRVRLVAELASPAIPTVVRDGNTVRWRFASNDVAMKTQNIKPTVIGGFGAASTPVAQQSVSQVPPAAGTRGRRIYHGATVEFDFKDAPIHDLLRIIADTGGVNIVVPDTIDAKVTVRLKRVPWDQALEVILASHGLWYRREGNLYRIATRKEIDAEDEAEAARRAASVAAEAPRPEVVTLNYASADELKPKFEQMLSPKGRIEVDGRTNSLIINDVSGSRDQIARLARSLDTQTPQITIEARIVEARSTFVRQFGIQWGGRALAGAAGGNATGLVFPSSIGIVGGNSDQNTIATGITALPSDFAINLPAATGSGEGGAIGMSLGSVGGNFNINLRLSALEDSGTVRIISAPKITVLNNKAALIRQGVSIPISVVSAAGTNTQFVQADLSLEVTPYVSQQDCAIAMNINVTKNEPDFVNVGARGDPTILRKEAKTTMLVNDGETSVLGGIYTRNSGLSYRKVPFLGDLPVLGWLFKNRRENDDRTEILVFITPKITNKASLRCQQ